MNSQHLKIKKKNEILLENLSTIEKWSKNSWNSKLSTYNRNIYSKSLVSCFTSSKSPFSNKDLLSLNLWKRSFQFFDSFLLHVGSQYTAVAGCSDCISLPRVIYSVQKLFSPRAALYYTYYEHLFVDTLINTCHWFSLHSFYIFVDKWKI